MEGEANNKLLDEEDTQRSNLNSKYVQLNSCAKYYNSLICFFLFDTCNERCDIAIRSICKRSRCVYFRRVSRLNLSNKKKYSKCNAIHSRIKKTFGCNMISNDTSDRLKSCCISLAYLLIFTLPPPPLPLCRNVSRLLLLHA